jgi:hypothetical protein
MKVAQSSMNSEFEKFRDDLLYVSFFEVLKFKKELFNYA